MALALGQEAGPLPPFVKDIVTKARTTWLKNSEVLSVLLDHKAYQLPVCKEAPDHPGGGLLFLFNRKSVRFFRKDGHEWRKKTDGKTVRETHEKLKIDNKDVLNCYYAHSEAQEALQRRCYWLLEGDGDVVLVHYLSSHPAAVAPSAGPSGSDDAMQIGFRRNSGSVSNAMVRAASSNTLASNANSQDSLMSARSLDRQPSIGPLHAAPTFSGGTVQTGNTVGLVEAPLLRRSGSAQPDCWHPSHSGLPDLKYGGASEMPFRTGNGVHTDASSKGVRIALSRAGSAPQWDGAAAAPFDMEPFRQEQESHARAWGELKRKERTAAAAAADEDDSLKPAISLTRVDSDTLKVAPSLSGATSGANAKTESRPMHRTPCPPQQNSTTTRMHASASSPFLATAFSGQPVQAKPHRLVKELMTEHSAGTPFSNLQQLSNQRQRDSASPASMPFSDSNYASSDRMKRWRSNEYSQSFGSSFSTIGATSPLISGYPGGQAGEGGGALPPPHHPALNDPEFLAGRVLGGVDPRSLHLIRSCPELPNSQSGGNGNSGNLPFGAAPHRQSHPTAATPRDHRGKAQLPSPFDSLSHDMDALEFLPMDMTYVDMDWAANLSR